MLSTKKMLAVAIAASTFVSSAQAALTNPGSWTRGDANSVYAEWDLFNSLEDSSADVGTANLVSGSVNLSASAGGFITGGGAGNQYAFNPGIWTVSVAGNGSGPVVGDNSIAYLKVRSLGSLVDFSSVTLGGQAASSSTILSSVVSSFMGSPSYDNIYLFSWNTTGVANWSFVFGSTGGHTSLAELAVDVNTVAAPAVPVPAAAWLLGSGLIGLASVARRRKV